MSEQELQRRVAHLEAEVRALRAFENAPYRAVVEDMNELIVRWKPDGTRVFVNDAAQRLEAAARSALAGMTEGDTLRTLLAALRRVLKVTPINTIALRRELADAAIRKGGYIL